MPRYMLALHKGSNGIAIDMVSTNLSLRLSGVSGDKEEPSSFEIFFGEVDSFWGINIFPFANDPIRIRVTCRKAEDGCD